MTLSPDGKRVAYLSDTLRVGNELFVVDLGAAGPSSPRKLSAPFPSDTQRVRTLAWSPDSRYLAYTGDVATSGIIEALVVDTDVGAPGPVTVNPPLPLNRSLALTSKPLWSPDGTALFYSMMDYALEGQLGVYRTLLAHAGEADELSLPLGAGESAQNIDNIGVAADAVTYAVRSSAGTYSLHYVSLSGSTPPRLCGSTRRCRREAIIERAPTNFSPTGPGWCSSAAPAVRAATHTWSTSPV